MSVVRVPPVLREEAGGAREVEASGATLRELLDDLTTRVPALGAKIYDGSEIRPYVNIYVDGEDVRTRGGLDAPVREGATVVLLPAMAGGDDCVAAIRWGIWVLAGMPQTKQLSWSERRS